MTKRYYQEDWDLSEILPKNYDQAFKKVKRLGKNFVKKYSGKLRKDISQERFNQMLSDLNEVEEEFMRLFGGYALMQGEDPHNSKLSKNVKSIESLGVEIGNSFLFFDKFIQKKLSSKDLNRLAKGSGDYERYVKNLRSSQGLETDVEKAINYKDISGINTRIEAHNKLFANFEFEMNIDGKVKKVNSEDLRNFRHNPSAKIRALSRRILLDRIEEFYPVISELYIGTVKDVHSEIVKIRNHSSAFSYFALDHDIPKKVLDLVLEVCQENKGIFNRFFKIKKEICNLKNPTQISDLYAPAKSEAGRTIKYDEGVKLVLKSFENFDPALEEIARDILDRKHFNCLGDKESPGCAYSWAIVTDTPPFGRVNYDNHFTSVLTLAHEMGHAVQFRVASKNHKYLVSDMPHIVGEVPSIFHEIGLTRYMLNDPSISVSQKREALVQELNTLFLYTEDCPSSVMFEKDIFRRVNSERGFSDEEISKLFLKYQKDMVGKNFIFPEGEENSWVFNDVLIAAPFNRILYPIGALTALILHEEFEDYPDRARQRYNYFLGTGGTRLPMQLYADMDYNVKSRAFWQSGFDIIKKRIKTLEDLV